MLVEQAYKNQKEEKVKRIEVRCDDSMLREIAMIRNQTGISISELVREGLRRIIKDAREKSEAKLI